MNHRSLPRLSGVFVSMTEVGTCRLCGERKDLRMGACHGCARYVAGKPIPGGHELWDSRNTSNRWKVTVQ